MPTSFDRMRDIVRGLADDGEPDHQIDYAITKAQDEARYTLGVMYVPGARDADDEYADVTDLQKACWDYFRSGYRAIRDTHTTAEIGELVELVSWPYEQVVEATTGDGSVFKYKLPAGTVYAGVIWDERAWPLVKAGKLRGYSMGGKAVRLPDQGSSTLPRMAELLAADDVQLSKDGKLENKPGKTNWVERAGGLPAYIRKIAEDLVDEHGESGAIRLAVGIVKRWCRGAGNVTAKTRAKACKAVAEWDRKRGASHKSLRKSWDPELGDEPTDDELDVAEGDLSPATLSEVTDDALDYPEETE